MANTFTGTTWNGKEAMTAVKAELYRDPLMILIMEIIEGVKAKTQIVFEQLWDDQIALADAGCGSGQVSKSIVPTEKFWNPKDIKAWTQTCESIIRESLYVWASKNGIDKKDLTDTDFGDYVLEQMTQALKRQIFNLSWFGDTNAALVTASPAGYYVSGTTLTYHNILDGFFEQLFDGVTAGTTPRYTITYNALTGYANQLNLAAGYAKTVFQNLYNQADERLLAKPNQVILCTRTLWQNWADYRAGQTGIESSWMSLENGVMQSSYFGVPIIPIYEWDRYIKTYLKDGTSYHLPHRALLTTVDNLAVAFDDFGEATDFKVFLDDTTELWNVKGGFRMDVKVKREEFASIAY